MCSATGRRRGNHPRARSAADSCRSGYSGRTTAARAARSPRGLELGDRAARFASRTSACHPGARPCSGHSTSLVDQAYFANALLCAPRATSRARELSLAVLVGRVGGRPRHPGPEDVTSTTASRQSSSGREASTVPSRGAAAVDRRDRQQLRAPHMSGLLRRLRSTYPTRHRSRPRRCWRSVRLLSRLHRTEPRRAGTRSMAELKPSRGQSAVSVPPSRASIAAMCSMDSGTGRPVA